MGEFIAASDGLSVSLYNFTKNGINKIYSKEFLNGVISVYPDIEHKRLYVAEQNGIISTWGFDGKLLKNLTLGINVYDIIFDKKMGRLLFNSNSGLYSFDKEKNTVNKLLNQKQRKVIIEPYSSRLKILADKGFVVYDYPVMRPIMIQNGSFGNIIKNDGGDFAAFNQINFIKVYDLKRNSQIATIALENPGVIKFLPPSDNYGGNVSSSFIDAANPDRDDESFETMLSQENVCANLSAIITGVYNPNFNQIKDVNIKNPKAVDEVAEPTVSEPTEAKGPIFTFKTGNNQVKEPKNPSFQSNVSEPSVATNAHNPDMVKAPSNPNVDNISSLMPTNVPNWIANRKNLPINNTVATSNSESDALKLGKSQVKNNLLKDVLKSIVKDESLKSIQDINVKKRILYQAASEAINNSPIKTKDKWISPAKQYYIHLELDNKNLDSLGKLYLSKEIEKYNKMGNKEYMSIKPNTLD